MTTWQDVAIVAAICLAVVLNGYFTSRGRGRL